MLEKHGIACDMMHDFNWDKWTSSNATGPRFSPGAPKGPRRFYQIITQKQ